MSVHSHAAAQKSSGAFFSVWDRERCRKSAGRGRNALRASQAVRATDVMVNSLGKHRRGLAMKFGVSEEDIQITING
ncbi:hypothetical protein D9E86_24740 [Escherichia coli]|jgi:hypothetical protein|nr:hypothetical protein [Escherichia coli]